MGVREKKVALPWRVEPRLAPSRAPRRRVRFVLLSQSRGYVQRKAKPPKAFLASRVGILLLS